MPLPDTFYARTLTETHQRPPLSGAHDTDTVIVGAGFAGLTTALHLARAGVAVTVLESQSVGFGASGRNGGMVSAGFACGGAKIAARVGASQAAALQSLAREGVAALRQTITDLAIPGADPLPGMLHLRRYDHATDMLAEARASNGTLTYLNRDALKQHLTSPRYAHGLYDPSAFHIHPLNTLRGIAQEVERLGGHIHENSPVTGADLGPTKTLTTPQGRITARRAVFATGGYTGPLIPRLKRAVLPIATYMMLTEAAPDLLAQAITTRAALVDDRRAGDYYRLVENGQRLLWGGRITTRAGDSATVAASLRAAMLQAYPQLAALKTELSWSGQMAYARHLMPQLGQLAPDVWHITAFGGHGLNTTTIAGTVLAEAILGQSDRISLFRPFGLTWAGGPVGLAVAQLTYWGLQAQDKWRERHI